MSFKSGVKCRGSDSKGGDCDEVMCAGRGEPWTRRRVNRIWLQNINLFWQAKFCSFTADWEIPSPNYDVSDEVYGNVCNVQNRWFVRSLWTRRQLQYDRRCSTSTEYQDVRDRGKISSKSPVRSIHKSWPGTAIILLVLSHSQSNFVHVYELGGRKPTQWSKSPTDSGHFTPNRDNFQYIFTTKRLKKINFTHLKMR